MPTQEMPATDNKSMSPFAAAIVLFTRLVGRALAQTDERSLQARPENSGQDSVPGLPATSPPQDCQPQQVSAEGLALIKRFEGCARKRRDGHFDAYPDPGTGADPWTIGWGATGPGIRKGTTWTQDECDARLEVDVARHAADVARAIGKASTTQAQFDALVSFHYNTGAIGRATLTRLHVAGDHAGAAREFSRWVRAGGQILAGLVRRRDAEVTLYCRQ
jgi:lysozyme